MKKNIFAETNLKMKSRELPNEKVEEIKHFIRETCQVSKDKTSEHYEFHKYLVQHYFKAKNVEIRYEAGEVSADITVANNNVTTINFGCPDLPTFLSSCIREDEETLQYCTNYIQDQQLLHPV